MEQKIHEVYEFFKSKLISGEYKIEKVTEHHVTLSISGFTFVIWTYSGSFGVSTYDGSFMTIAFNSSEKDAAWSKLAGPVAEYRRNELIAKKRAELAALEHEISVGHE